MTGAGSSEGSGLAGQVMMLTAVALMGLGLVMVASAGASLDRPLFSTAVLRTSFGRQLVFALLALAVMYATANVAAPRILGSARWVSWCVGVSVLLALGCLVGVLVPGAASEVRGSHRWLRLSVAGFDIGFQPSELAKPALAAWLAWWISRRGEALRRFWRGFLPASLLVGAFIGLVGVEDFGTAALIALLGGAMLLAGGCRWTHLGGLALLGVAGFAVLLLAEPYRVQRLLAFRDIWADPRGIGYHQVQSLTTIASGGWFGQGLGAGVQKYGYLPEARTDFIFAVICEETGAIGAFLVIGLFIAFAAAGVRTVVSARTPFESLLAFGLTLTIALQAAMNIAVVTVSAPTTGISLPFISAGGSGLVVFGAATGLVAAVAARGRPSPNPASAESSDAGEVV